MPGWLAHHPLLCMLSTGVPAWLPPYLMFSMGQIMEGVETETGGEHCPGLGSVLGGRGEWWWCAFLTPFQLETAEECGKCPQPNLASERLCCELLINSLNSEMRKGGKWGPQ